jgi:hypothetical protein
MITIVHISISMSPQHLPPISIVSSCMKVFFQEDLLNPSPKLVDDRVHAYDLFIWMVEVL